MTAVTAADVADLVARGHRVCSCGAVLRPSAAACRFCGAAVTSDASLDAPTQPRKSRRRKPASEAFNPDAGRGRIGSLADLPGQRLVLHVTGDPVSQGSLRAVAAGVVRRESGPALVAWRNAITTEALRVCGAGWVPANAGVRVDIVFTVPRPTSAPARAVSADGYRDLDKLVRAVDDALCPDDPARFRVLASDMRIVSGETAKTHARPMHTHPWALPEPGVVIAVGVPDPPNPALPCPSATDPVWRAS